MELLEIVKYPDKRLRLKSEKILNINDEIRSLVDKMIDTMHANNGLGLAAIQVGVPKRLFIIDWHQHETNEIDRSKVMVFINPEITDCSEEIISKDEGCLSLPGIKADVKRFKRCKVKAFDINGKPFEMEPEELLSVACQHEYDHLNGILYIDRLSQLKRELLVKKYKKLLK